MEEPTRHGLAFLVGAGASREAGFPIASDLLEEMERSFEVSRSSSEDANERALIGLGRLLYTAARQQVRAADNPFVDPDNFEAVFATINDLRFRFRSRLRPFVSQWDQSLAQFSGFPEQGGIGVRPPLPQSPVVPPSRSGHRSGMDLRAVWRGVL